VDFTWASVFGAWKTTFPLAMYVFTCLNPAFSHIDFNSDMGSAPVPPTLTARNNAMNAFMQHTFLSPRTAG
jgi:hypothetical protein